MQTDAKTKQNQDKKKMYLYFSSFVFILCYMLFFFPGMFTDVHEITYKDQIIFFAPYTLSHNHLNGHVQYQ